MHEHTPNFEFQFRVLFLKGEVPSFNKLEGPENMILSPNNTCSISFWEPGWRQPLYGSNIAL